MKRFVLGALALLVVGGLAAYTFGIIKFGTYSRVCLADDEIASVDRTAIENAGMAFETAALGAQPQSAYAMMTQEAQNSVSAEKLSSELGAIIQQSGPYTNPKLVHTYYLQTTGGKPSMRAICGSINGPDKVSVSVKPGSTQAHVVISTQTHNNDWAFTIWLLHERDAWRVEYFHIGVSSIVGHSPDNMLQLVREQRDSGHAFNAEMLYVGLQAIIDRGPAFQLGLVQVAQGDFQKFKAPPKMQGKPPFTWKMNGNQYKVAGVGIIGIGDKLGLTFALPQETWNGDDDANMRNHAFLDAFIATHADYAPTFGFLVAQAHKPDGSGGFATVYEAGTGYK